MSIITVEDSFSVTTAQDVAMSGSGSIYTAQASGTTGQTALIQGTNSNPTLGIWTTVAKLTVGAENTPDSAVWQASWRFYQVTGTAVVTIARDSA